MKSESLRKRLFREAVFAAAALAVGAVILFAISVAVNNIEQEATIMRNDQGTLMAKITSAESEYKAVVTAWERYKDIPPQRLPSGDGLNTSSSRLRAAKPVIESLKSRYRLGSLEITFSNIEPDLSFNAGGSIIAFKNEIRFTFKSASDELILSFLNDLIRDFPGYLRFKDIELRRSTNDRMTASALQSMAKSGGSADALVDGSATMIWVTLKDIPGKKADSASPGGT